MSAREFAEWLAVYRDEPFGDVRGDLQAALIAEQIFNANRGTGQPSAKIGNMIALMWTEKPPGVEWMAQALGAGREPMSGEDMEAQFSAMVDQHNAVLDQKKGTV